MNPTNNKKLETLIYVGIWLVAIILFLLDIMRGRSYTSLPLLDWAVVGRMALTLVPFMTLFAINNYLLIPRLLKRGHYAKYLIFALCVIALIWIWQQFQFSSISVADEARKLRPRPPHHGPHPLMPLPIFLDLICDFLIVGMNLVVSLIFQNFADRLKHESLMKENAENQLTYLKAQINPHFYMNMLNNIHGMIEIDTEKAQEMVIEMSSLMRYMLYDSSRPEINVASEVDFIKDYLALMRVRYPEDIVKISAHLPAAKDVAGIKIPPLLFLVFLENAFKHGISFSTESFVTVSLTVEDGAIVFRSMNSIPKATREQHRQGIGLENVKRRLDLIYGRKYSLDIDSEESTYTVTLSLPPYETKNPGD